MYEGRPLHAASKQLKLESTKVLCGEKHERPLHAGATKQLKLESAKALYKEKQKHIYMLMQYILIIFNCKTIIPSR